jgi:hypothetical protein
MLGEPEDSVRGALGALDGAIAYDHEEVSVRDRAALERESCDCYEIVREEYERLLEPAAVNPSTGGD